MKQRLFFALQVVLLAMMGFWGPAQADNPQLTTHDANQTSQHNGLSGQVSTHDAAQTSQHNGLSGQVTTHDAAQTSQHKELEKKIDNLGNHSGLPPTWDKILPADNPGGPCPSNSSRFTCVMGGAAVRDNETGLVWEQSPSTLTFPWASTTDTTAALHCNFLALSNRLGWRLPTLQELASLVDRSQQLPALPAGHPFNKDNVQSSNYWSATTVASNTSDAWFVQFGNGGINGSVGSDGKGNSFFAWCVRGGQGVDPQ